MMRCSNWISSRSSIGLNTGIEHFLWFVKTNEGDVAWHLTNYEDRHPLTAVFVVFGDDGYVLWDTVLETKGVIRKYMLIPLTGILMFPWEMVEEKETIKEVSGVDVMVSYCAKTRPQTLEEDPSKAVQVVVNYLKSLKDGSLVRHEDATVPDIESEAHAISVLVDLGFSEQLKNKTIWCDPTVRDLHLYMSRYGVSIKEGPSSLPSMMFTIPFEEFPQDPIYGPNGVSHLSWRELGAWLKSREEMIINERVQKNIYKELHSDWEGNVDKFRDGQFNVLLKKQKTIESNSNSNSNVYHDVDIEDFMENGCPPCIKNKLKERRAFKDQERYQLACQLRSGKISEQSAEKIFEVATNNEGMKWTHKTVWKNNYVGEACSVFISNAEKNIPTTIHCPFKSTEKCLKNFKETHPNQSKPTDVLKYPFQVILWNYSRRK